MDHFPNEKRKHYNYNNIIIWTYDKNGHTGERFSFIIVQL